MEHITIKNLEDGFFRLTPDKGYVLRSNISGRKYSEAITKTPSEFEAVDE